MAAQQQSSASGQGAIEHGAATLDAGSGRRAFDEMHAAAGGTRPPYREFEDWLQQQSAETMRNKRAEADLVFRRVGITFAVYGEKDVDGGGTERLIPFDVIPRIIAASEWRELQAGLRQRVRALNLFLHDVYHDQNIIRAGRIPTEQVLRNLQFRPEMHGVDVANGIYAHIAGIDIVRAENAKGDAEFYVLEDNLRVPSGVSYMLENRKMMMRLFPDLFARNRVAPVAHYPDLLLENLRSVAPQGVDNPTVVLMTPGMYNSAYFEHSFLAQRMGVVCQLGCGAGAGVVLLRRDLRLRRPDPEPFRQVHQRTGGTRPRRRRQLHEATRSPRLHPRLRGLRQRSESRAVS